MQFHEKIFFDLFDFTSFFPGLFLIFRPAVNGRQKPESEALVITASSSIVSSSTKGVNALSGADLPLGLESIMGSPEKKVQD